MDDTSQETISPAGLVRIEASALEQLAARLEGAQQGDFSAALDGLERAIQAGGRVILCGIGKSGLIARKVSATLTSLSIRAAFLHPAEALHGDLGLVAAGDAVLFLSYSGETEELLHLLPTLRGMRLLLIAITGCPQSSLARASDHVLDVSVDREACTHQLAPTASTTAMLALGDALAITLSQRLGFVPQAFAALHPGGSLGRRLTSVRDHMHSGDALPTVVPDAPMTAVIHEMSTKRLGMTLVQDTEGRLLGILSDGDLRRLFEREGPQAFHRTAAEVMSAQPRTVEPTCFSSDALRLMEEHKITALILTEDGTPGSRVCGVVHLHDLVQALTPGQEG